MMQEPTSRPPGGFAQEVAIGEDEAGQRIDNWLLRRLKGWSRGQVYRLLRSGQVRVNKGRIRPAYRLEAGDRLRLPPQASQIPAGSGGSAAPKTAPPPTLLRRLRDAVLHEDDSVLVVDKPAGIAVHGGSGVAHGVIEALRALRPQAPFLELVHRLDRETSGCLLLAKSRRALLDLHRQFRDGEVEKRYLALVAGDWQLGEHRVDLPLEVSHRRDGERHVRVPEQDVPTGARSPVGERRGQETGKAAASVFRLVQGFRECSLLEVIPETGRTHQIRVHAQAVGHPLAGDDRYGDPEVNDRLAGLGLQRLFLHAHMLTFNHPESGDPCSISTPLPDDLRAVLDRLGTRRPPARRNPGGRPTAPAVRHAPRRR